MRFTKLSNSKRFLDNICKKAAPYTEDWESEYGEDYQNIDQEVEQELDAEAQFYFSREQREKGKVVLSLMGEDITRYSEGDIDTTLIEKPHLLELNPVFDVSGQWVHALRQTDINKVLPAVQSLMSQTKELCVTSGQGVDFWNFSEYRIFAMVLEGTCKVLWNADMYSHTNQDDQLFTDVGQPLQHINEMTEGWLVPSQCTLVGIKINPDLQNKDVENFEPGEMLSKIDEIAKTLGVPVIQSENLEKQLIDIEFYSNEDLQQFSQCEVDLESPEHLYEDAPVNPLFQEEGWGDVNPDLFTSTYLEEYQQDLNNAVKQGDFAKVEELLNMGITPRKDIFNTAAASRVPYELFKSLVDRVPSIPGVKDLGNDLLKDKSVDKLQLLIDKGLISKKDLWEYFVSEGEAKYYPKIQEEVFNNLVE